MQLLSKAQSVLIIGAGIFGVTASLELNKRGYTVTLADPGPLPHPDAASNDMNKFVRMDYGHDEFYISLMEEAFKGWYGWNARWRRPVYHETGGLFMVHDRMEPGGFEYESYVRLQKRGYSLERLTPDLIKEYLPGVLYGRYKDGYYNRKAGWAEAGELLTLLVEDAKVSGVDVTPGVKITELSDNGNYAPRALTEDGEEIRADYVIVAAGVWTPLLVPELKELMWATGQPVFYLKSAVDAGFLSPHHPATWLADISKTGWYGFPALPDGTVKISNHGPGRRMRPDDPREITEGDEKNLTHFLSENIPVLADAPVIKTRLCPYADTWDADFYIDRVPGRPGLIVATGGSGHAFKFAPVLGSLIADVLENKPNPYLHRFAWREKGEAGIEEERSREIE
ncbi:MAG: FAD-binding oxidoreductase [Deltaproteobacteria bacterium]